MKMGENQVKGSAFLISLVLDQVVYVSASQQELGNVGVADAHFKASNLSKTGHKHVMWNVLGSNLENNDFLLQPE